MLAQLSDSVQFARPYFLWLLLVLPIIWMRFRTQRFIVIFWRSVILILLVLTLADPQVVGRIFTHTQQDERIFAFDVSRSIPTSTRQWMAATAEKLFAPKSGERVYLFGGEIKETSGWREALNAPAEPDGVLPDKTNLESLLSRLTAQPPAPRTLFLFTDGWETQGDVQRLLPAAAAAGIKIFPVARSDRPAINNVAVRKLIAPSHGKSADAVNLKVAIENQNDRNVEGTLTLTRDGQTFRSEPLKLAPGSHLFTYQATLPEGPLISYRASFAPRQAELDRYSQDNQALAWVTVRTKAKVLLISDQVVAGRYLEEVLKRQGFDVTSRTPDAAPPPTGYKMVIFNNPEREKFPASYFAAVERHTAEGNGFLMLGSEASFSPNSYRRTPIEALLPVDPKEPKREERNRAVVLVIDKSGSMRDDNRLLYAKETAKGVIRQLKDDDFIGVVAFDAGFRTVVPVNIVSRVRASFDRDIDSLAPSGQTYFFPALLEAKRQIERTNVARRHVILLSDGETRGSQGDLLDLISVMKKEMKITVSAVAIGSEADIRIMKRIAQYGGGFFHFTADPSSLPQIVMQQLQENPREEAQAPKDFVPVPSRGSELLAPLAIRNYPAIYGYMETELKPGAQGDLLIPRDDRRAPLLASWKYGRGRAVALTMDLEGRWSRSWVSWGGLSTLWERVFDWLSPRVAEEPIPEYEARVSSLGERPVLDLLIFEDQSADSQFRSSVSGKGVKSDLSLKRLAAGHYQAALPISAPGEYRIDIVENRRGRQIAYPALGFTQPYAVGIELPRADSNVELLARLAETTGGKLNPQTADPQEPRSEVTKSYRPIRQPIIVLAFILFLLEVFARRIFFSEFN